MFFVDEERLVGSGTHTELLAEPAYRRLVSRGSDLSTEKAP